FLSKTDNKINIDYKGFKISIKGNNLKGSHYYRYSVSDNYLLKCDETTKTDSTNYIKIDFSVKNVDQMVEIFYLILLFSKLYVKFYNTDRCMNVVRNDVDAIISERVNLKILSRYPLFQDRLLLAGKMARYAKNENDVKPIPVLKSIYLEYPKQSRYRHVETFLGRKYKEYYVCIDPNNFLIFTKSKGSFFFEDILYPRCSDHKNVKRSTNFPLSTGFSALEYGNFGNVSPSLLDVYQNIITRERE